jgi:15-cis-phytoene synthase
MTLEIPLQNWEYQLLTWAQEPLKNQPLSVVFQADSAILEASYRYCDNLTRFHSRTFYMASSLLPYEKRRAARALYAFCRVTDDLVDNNPDPQAARQALEDWRSAVSHPNPLAYEPVAVAWADAQRRFQIPQGYADQLIQGVARDLHQKRYSTFADLAEYSYGVASTVGLMVMYIVGFRDEDAVPYAVKLGVALQMTNILRDVGEDWRNGRLYLPQDELDGFNLTESQIDRGQVDARWRAFMDFQIARNRQLYAESQMGIRLLNADGRFAIAAAADLYRAILKDIEHHDYDVFSRRSRVSTLGKLQRLPKIWWQSRVNA